MLDLLIGVAGAKVRALLGICPVSLDRARVVQVGIPGEESRTQCPACVSRRGLNPNIVKGTFPEDSSIPDAVQCNAARQHQVLLAGFTMDVAGHAKHDLLGHVL